MSVKIRFATQEDSVAILGIYESYIRDTAITFEYEVPSVSDFNTRIENIMRYFPWLVCEIDGEVAGYGYAFKHGERAAYQWSADLSIYINEKHHRKHIATALYTALIEMLKLQGYYTVFAGVTIPNPNSEAFHTSFGFQKVGVFNNVGYKLGEWRDVKWFAFTLSEYKKEPKPPVAFSDIKDKKIIREIVNKAEEIIRED